jgi:hypothetical protein
MEGRCAGAGRVQQTLGAVAVPQQFHDPLFH